MAKRSFAELDRDASDAIEPAQPCKRIAKQDPSYRFIPQNTLAGFGWEPRATATAALDEDVVRHLLSGGAATSNYAQSWIYYHWAERMRGGWVGRKMMDNETATTEMMVH